MADIKRVDKPEPIRCKCTNNYSWIFWLILLAINGYLVYFIITTIQQIQENPEDFFHETISLANIAIGVLC